MKYLYIFCVLAFACVIRGRLDDGSEILWTTPSIIARHGYPVEVYAVQTSDGYILTMHRIPYSRTTGNDGSKRPVAFLMHGLLGSSSDFVLNGPNKALAYILSESGFDVWLGNARGNKYSRNHAYKNPNAKAFWNFDWHHIGIRDLPAMIDYALYWTGTQEVRYFGHSQGTTAFLVLNSMDPTYLKKIRSAHFLAPVAFMEHAKSPVLTLTGPFLGQPSGFVELYGTAELLPDAKLLDLLGKVACSENSLIQDVCGNILFLIAGWDSPFQNDTMIPEIMATVPSGASMNQIIHYSQLKLSGKFRQFDNGFVRNTIEYNQRTPPNYFLGNILAPIYMYYSDNDALAAVKDVERLKKELPGVSLKRAYRIPYPKFNHLDFLWGMHVENILYSEIIADVMRS